MCSCSAPSNSRNATDEVRPTLSEVTRRLVELYPSLTLLSQKAPPAHPATRFSVAATTAGEFFEECFRVFHDFFGKSVLEGLRTFS